ncbi:hypothetical protein [Orlajensenia flava]|uniref:hypothetical protein n=1 Tax=Orlajensenia flava TaxID=2565934 RepID=UPI001455252F|nr:hypothetical protein [Glaciibacter flavus]
MSEVVYGRDVVVWSVANGGATSLMPDVLGGNGGDIVRLSQRDFFRLSSYSWRTT